MADGLERRPNHSPEAQPIQIWQRKQSGIEARVYARDGNEPGRIVGRLITEFIVVNSKNARIVSIRGASEVRKSLRQELMEYARGNGLHVLPSERIDPSTKQWLADNQLPDRYFNPNI